VRADPHATRAYWDCGAPGSTPRLFGLDHPVVPPAARMGLIGVVRLEQSGRRGDQAPARPISAAFAPAGVKQPRCLQTAVLFVQDPYTLLYANGRRIMKEPAACIQVRPSPPLDENTPAILGPGTCSLLVGPQSENNGYAAPSRESRDRGGGHLKFPETLLREACISLLLEGEAGIGKTTMWLAAADEARARGCMCSLRGRR